MTTQVRVESTPASTRPRVALAASEAVHSVTRIARDALLCCGFAWFVSWYIAQGNLASRADASEQSYALTIAHVVTLSFLSAAFMIFAMLTHVLHSQSRIIRAGQEDALPLWRCALKLSKRIVSPCILAFVAIQGVAYLFSRAPASLRPLKLEFYVGCAINHLFICYSDLATRDIIRQETRATPAQATASPPQQQSEECIVAATPVSAQHRQRRQQGLCARYWRHSTATLPNTLFVQAAGVFVHLTKDSVLSATQRNLALFTLGSTLVKICTQEAAKRVALAKNVRDIRMMSIAIGVPTVLIDTQVRLLLQRLQTKQGSAAGILGIAALEVTMRIAKTQLVKLEIAWLRAPLFRFPRSSAKLLARVAPTEPAAAVAASPEALDRRERSIRRLYMAEVHADMAAEYLAIGCSAAIMCFFRSHPKFLLNATGAPSSTAAQVTSIAAQVAAEIVIDVVACTVEIRGGMNFRELHRHGAFVLLVFVYLAVLSIQISAIIYLRTS